ncbi:MAG TPA: Shedu immune nuclease family protein [Candidatus Paceibacterota bacterium]|jgi:hypothetical protein|nr:Shedu immune nuclease family protein [Candidatus Paceibacterota bacterium]
MAWDTKIEDGIEKVYFIDEETKKETIVFDIDSKNELIKFYPREEKFFLKEIVLSGFKEVPENVIVYGTFKGGLLYFLNDRFSDKKVFHFEILRDGKSLITNTKNGLKVLLAYDDVLSMVQKLTSISYEAKIERGEEVDLSLYNTFPKYFKKSNAEKSSRNKARRLLRNLDISTIPQLKNQEAQKIVDYFIELIEKRSNKQSFFNLAKLKLDEVSIENVILKLKDYIENNAKESEWTTFLIENLFVIDSKYIYAVPEINLTLGGNRRVDFGLIDSDGYLDIFEIKRPNTKIFETQPDHGNYFWHEQAVQAIVQAEKYLYSATRKGSQLVEDLQRERGVELPFKVIRPRAFLLMGSSSQFKNVNMVDDFQVLRRSQKNIEIILYDDLLKRIQNQKGKVFLSSQESS